MVAALNARRCGGGVLRAAADSPTLCEERELHPDQSITESKGENSVHVTSGFQDRGGLDGGGGRCSGSTAVWGAFQEEVRHCTPSVGVTWLTSYRQPTAAVPRLSVNPYRSWHCLCFSLQSQHAQLCGRHAPESA